MTFKTRDFGISCFCLQIFPRADNFTEKDSNSAVHSYPRPQEEEEQTTNVWLKGHAGPSLQVDPFGLGFS